MRSERGTAEQTALARDGEQSGEGEREAGMTNYSSWHSVGDRLPRWICISPEPGRMGRSGGKTDRHTVYTILSYQHFFFWCFFLPVENCNGDKEGNSFAVSWKKEILGLPEKSLVFFLVATIVTLW